MAIISSMMILYHLKWNKQELQAYLIHHNLKKSRNKPDLVFRKREHKSDTDFIMHADLGSSTSTSSCRM